MAEDSGIAVKVTIPSMARINIELKRKTSKLTVLSFIHRDSAILFWDSEPLAVLSGGYVSAHYEKASSAKTLAIHEWQGDAPVSLVGAAEFDFVVGQLLTQAGLPLTRRAP